MFSLGVAVRKMHLTSKQSMANVQGSTFCAPVPYSKVSNKDVLKYL